jgi:IS1 family transposase
MSQLTPEQRLRVVSALVQGNSISATVKMTGVAKSTILRLIVKLGAACKRLHDRLVRDLRCHFIELDEQWSFIQKKEKRRTDLDDLDAGDVFTYSALDRNSRLVVAYAVGKRTQETTDAFVADLRSRVLTVPIVSMDGFGAYPAALAKCFEAIDAGQVIKQYRSGTSPDYKYEPARDAHFIRKQTVLGAPAHADLSTSLVERYHLTMRHTNGRKRRLCLAFSKCIENHEATVNISIAAYNWTHVVATLKRTPAHAVGLTDHTWTLDELIEVALSMPEDQPRPVAKPLELREDRGPSRTLPNGKGFLRLVGGVSVARPVAEPAATASRPMQQLNLFDD